MAKSNRLGLRVKPNDEKILLMLADHLERNLSDTVRFAIRETARHYGLLPKKKSSSSMKTKSNDVIG